MDEKKFVTIEMFEQYHKKLMEYIKTHDDLILNGETINPDILSDDWDDWDDIK